MLYLLTNNKVMSGLEVLGECLLHTLTNNKVMSGLKVLGECYFSCSITGIGKLGVGGYLVAMVLIPNLACNI